MGRWPSRDGFLRLSHQPGWRIYNKIITICDFEPTVASAPRGSFFLLPLFHLPGKLGRTPSLAEAVASGLRPFPPTLIITPLIHVPTSVSQNHHPEKRSPTLAKFKVTILHDAPSDLQIGFAGCEEL